MQLLKQILRQITLVMFLFSWTYQVLGQEDFDSLLYKEGVINQNGYCITRIPGLGKPKGFELNYRNIYKYGIDTKLAVSDTVYSDFINRDRKTNIKAKVPIVLKDNFSLILGLQYASEEFKFKEQGMLNNSFYSALNEKSLKTYGTTIYALKPFKGKNFFSMRSSFRVSGDFSQNSLEDYFRTSISLLYGWRRSSTFIWGTGLSYNYTFGRQIVIPVLTLSKKINERWSIDGTLPVSMKIRYAASEKNIFEFENKISGENYNITLESITNYNLFIQRSDWFAFATYEREVFDFIWIGVKMGNRYNISFDLYEKNAFISRSNPVISNHLKNTFFVEMNLFLVPPKKLKDKFDKREL
ncbi:MAG: hypothetical protein ACI9XP_000366 [Lentimonas sp.]|jgi:hypothetical protein